MTTIALLGSGEFLPWAREVDMSCIEASTAPSERVLIVATASAPEGDDVFRRWGEMGVVHYEGLGLAPEAVPLRTREDASDPAIVDSVAGARLIFFSGGNPGYLAETLIGTPFWDAVLAALREGAAFGGCSAGATFLGALAPYLVNDELDRWVPGVGLLERAFVLPHFDQLEHYAPGLRDLALGLRPEGAVTVGIDETTALVGTDGAWRVAGELGVWIAGDAPRDLKESRAGDLLDVRLGFSLA